MGAILAENSGAVFMLMLFSGAAVLVVLEILALDLVAMLLLVAVVAAGILPADAALSGFASEVVISLAAVFVIAGTVARAGIAEVISGWLLRRAEKGEARALALVMLLAASLSTVFSNTSTTSVLTPAVIGFARRARIGAGRLLMPLAFASMMGGSMTLIGTSTNLAASGLVADLGLEPYRFFEFFPVGLALTLAGTAFMVLVGRRLVPNRRPLDLAEEYEVRRYLSELTFGDDSLAVGGTIGDLKLPEMELRALTLVRGGRRRLAHPLYRIEAGDRIMVKGTLDGLLRAREDKRFAVEAGLTDQEEELRPSILGLAEGVVMPQSRLVGATLGKAPFLARSRLAVLAVHRRGRALTSRLDALRLEPGDVLLVQGAADDLAALKGNPDLWGLVEVGPPKPTPREGLAALGLLTIAVALASSGFLPLAISLMGAVVVLALTGITPVQEAYRMIDFRLLVMVAGMTAFGLAMLESGAAELLALALTRVFEPFGITANLAALSVLTVIMTQPLSNAAAALTMMPIAVSTAGLIGVDPRSVAILVTLSASLSFIAPLEPALLLVYGPGRYRFRDFLVAGGALSALTVVLLVLLVPVFFPL